MQVNEDNIQERRGYPRVKKLYLLSYVNKESGRQVSPVLMGRTLDVSPSGVRVEVFQRIGINSEMELEIACNEESITAKGVVVRSNRTGNEVFVVGIKFNESQPLLAERPLP
ncbi:hypothetical protein PITCH_A1670020 [uncultured Desulfobacterium sp.]|uniref:PilZ domain-containing protein n=1 Tax=uncultured Desulfobacterium sp. TaxID=201089 RepID=A0A445MUA1_9BACT|nr:hypothetical protein PITCH_A1670020 [uncultured Desulfobacterium sp.]